MTITRWLATAVLLGSGILAQGATITLTDPYPGSSYPTTNPDIFGDPNKFDIESLQIVTTPGSAGNTNVTITIRENYNYGDTTLSNFPNANATRTLAPADLLFRDSGGNYLYGIPLVTHNGSANTAASNGGPATTSSTVTAGTLTANQVLNNPDPADLFRRTQAVWLAGGTALATGSVSTSLAPGATNPNEIQVVLSLSLANSSAFLAAL